MLFKCVQYWYVLPFFPIYVVTCLSLLFQFTVAHTYLVDLLWLYINYYNCHFLWTRCFSKEIIHIRCSLLSAMLHPCLSNANYCIPLVFYRSCMVSEYYQTTMNNKQVITNPMCKLETVHIRLFWILFQIDIYIQVSGAKLQMSQLNMW